MQPRESKEDMRSLELRIYLESADWGDLKANPNFMTPRRYCNYSSPELTDKYPVLHVQKGTLYPDCYFARKKEIKSLKDIYPYVFKYSKNKQGKLCI